MGPAVRRWSRWAVAAGCPVVAAVLLVAVAPGVATAEPAPGSVRVLQMNLCDGGGARCYTGRSIAEAAAVIRAERPDAVTLNEVCRDDVAVLGRALAAARPGPAPRTAFRPVGDRRTGGSVRCRNGQPYGIGVLTRLGGPGGYATTGGAYPVQDGRSRELRAWLCLHPRGGADAPRGVAVCTTHLANDNPVVAGGQCAHLLGTVLPAIRTGSGGAPLVLAGDLNLAADGVLGVRSCVSEGDRCVDDGVVQHVVASPELSPGAPRVVRLRQTDHPGLLVTLTLSGSRRAAR